MMSRSESRTELSTLNVVWPYAAFVLFVSIYSYLTLGHGFNATDEGYLLSLGARVAGGELPYSDFYFLRTPLSLYIQAAFIRIFGDTYTILLSRIIWTIQMCLAMMLISVLYRRLVRPWELFLLLLTTYTVSTMLMIFSWYSYDAILFAILTVLLTHYRQFALAGVAAFLASMCKQNYVILLPVFFVISVALQRWWPQLRIISLRNMISMAAGFLVPLLGYLGYLHLTDRLSGFWNNVFVYPRMASKVSVWFVLFQNHHEVFYIGIPAVLAGVVLFYLNSKRVIPTVIAVAASLLAIVLMFKIHHNFIYSLVYVNVALSVVMVIRMVRVEAVRTSSSGVTLLPALVLGVVIQYAAGFNYTGVVLAYMGSGLLLAVWYVMFREASPASNKRGIAVALLVGFLVIGLYHKYTYVYRDVARRQHTERFSSAKLAGVTSSPRNVRQIDGLVKAAQQYALPGKSIFVFPDMPALYYLADRENPTPIGWYVQLEYGSWLMPEILQSLRTSRPKVIFVQRYFEIDFERSGALIDHANIPRYAPIVDFIAGYYRLERNIGDVYVFLPN